MKLSLPSRETIITHLIKGTGYSAILFVLLIFFFLAREGLPAINSRIIGKLFGTRWYPIENYFGLLPLIAGSVIVTLGAALVAVPLGIGTAVFIREVTELTYIFYGHQPGPTGPDRERLIPAL